MRYAEYKKQRQDSFNKLPMKAAFGDQQFARMMAEWGLDATKDEDLKKVRHIVVDGGRKYRGEGVLVKLHKNESYYGTTESVSIWTGEKTVFANPRFVKVDAEMVFTHIFEMIDGMTFSDLYTFINKFYDMHYKEPIIIALEMACPIAATNRPALADKRKDLREWVAEKFNGNTPEEQERITHCIMIKKYGKDIE